MKALLTTILIASLAVSSFGQAKSKQASVNWGPIHKISKKERLKGIVGYGNDHVYLLYVRYRTLASTKYSIKAYNNKLQPTRESEFELDYKGNSLFFEKSIQLDGKVFLFSSYINKKQKKNYLFVQEIDDKRLRPSKEIKKVAEIDFSGKWNINSGEFKFDYSIDSSRILVYYDLPYDKQENEKFGLHVLDKEMNTMWSREVTIPIKEKLASIEDFTISNQGNVYVLVKKYDKKAKEKRKGEVNYSYVLLGYRENNDQVSELSITLGDLYLKQMGIAVNPEEEVICVGFYNDEKEDELDGSFYLRMNGETGEALSKNYQPFSEDFLLGHNTERFEKKKKKKLSKGKDLYIPEFKTKAIILHADGSVISVSEDSYVTVLTQTTPEGQVSQTYFFHDNNIAIIKIQPSGEIEWSKRITKYQYVRTNDYNSFALFPHKDKLHFIYNDNPENLFAGKRDPYAYLTNPKKSQLVIVTMEPNGEQEKGFLSSSKESKVIGRPVEVVKVSDDQALILGTWGRKNRLGTINFK